MWTALAIGVVGLVSALVGGVVTAKAQKDANETNKQLQQEANEANAASVAATNQTNIDLQREAMAFNSAEAEKQRAWEEEMSNTAIRRRMNDLQKAGVNPLLALGDGASSFSGPAASASSTRVQPSNSEAARVQAVDGMGDGLQSLASIAQSAAFMMALSASRRDAANIYARSRADVANINSASRTSAWDQYTYKLQDGSWYTSRKYK